MLPFEELPMPLDAGWMFVELARYVCFDEFDCIYWMRARVACALFELVVVIWL